MSTVDDPLEELGVKRVEHVEEVLSWWAFALRVLIWKVPDEEIIPNELRPQCFDRDLFIMWHLDRRDVGLLDQCLLVGKNLFEEVLVHDRGRRQVELQTKKKMRRIVAITYCLSRYYKKSCLLLSFHWISWAIIYVRERFLELSI